MFFSKKKSSFFILIFFCVTTAIAQTECIDYDIAAYPKIINSISYPWNGSAWNFSNMKQKKVTGLNIGGNGMFKGLLEYKPSSYSLPANSSKKYPVIIFFHGFASRGEGTVDNLCRILKDRGSDLATHKSLPGRVERETSSFTQNDGVNTYEYLVISPQFTVYNRPPNEADPFLFPSADEVENVINYVVSQYRIDERRIYLTGLSNGANMIVEYAASSVARAKRVAAIMPVSFCSKITSLRNTERNYVPQNIGAAGLPTWFVQCNIDNPCTIDFPTEWVNAIKATSGSVTPRFTVLNNSNADPLYQCSDSLTHDAWSRAYDPNFRQSFVNGTGANDGINKNMYEWFTQQTNAALPVKLKTFTVRLIEHRVELKWVTSDEKDNASFTIERAGLDQNYISIGAIPGAINSAGDKAYSFIDNKPLEGIGFYRLVQTDIDGEKTFFDIKRIINSKDKKSLVIISPNPVATAISAFISIDKTQKVFLSLTDMTGKILRNVNGIYGQGSSEVRISVNDLPKGIYLLKVSGENFSNTQKVFKK